MSFQIPRPYRMPLAIAIGLHLLIMLFLLIHPSGGAVTKRSAPAPRIMHAAVINSKAIDKEIRILKKNATAKRRAQAARIKALNAKAAAAVKRRRLAQQRLVKLKRQQKLQAKRLLVLQKKRQAAAVKLKAAQKLARQKALQRQAAKRKAAMLAAKKAAALKAQQAKLEKQLMRQQLSSDQTQISQSQQQHLQQLASAYNSKIKHAVRNHWLKPSGLSKPDIATEFYITLAPGGVVINVKLVHSSGNTVFDQSAKEAILKTSPLPVPKDPAAFSAFRQFYFTFYASPKRG